MLRERHGNAGTPHTERTRVAEEIRQHTKDSHTIEGFSLRLFKDIIKRCNNFRSHWKEIGFKLGLALCFLVLFSLSTPAGIFSANVVLDSVALCKSPWCGYWGAIHGLGVKTESTILRISKERQVAAAAQAANCYRDSSSNNKCNSLISRHVSYTRYSAAPCPLNGDVCVGGANEAFRLDTGYQKASARHQLSTALSLQTHHNLCTDHRQRHLCENCR